MVGNQVRVQVRYKITTWETSRTDHTKIYSNYIGNKLQLQQKSYKNQLVVTIIQYR